MLAQDLLREFLYFAEGDGLAQSGAFEAQAVAANAGKEIEEIKGFHLAHPAGKRLPVWGWSFAYLHIGGFILLASPLRDRLSLAPDFLGVVDA